MNNNKLSFDYMEKQQTTVKNEKESIDSKEGKIIDWAKILERKETESIDSKRTKTQPDALASQSVTETESIKIDDTDDIMYFSEFQLSLKSVVDFLDEMRKKPELFDYFFSMKLIREKFVAQTKYYDLWSNSKWIEILKQQEKLLDDRKKSTEYVDSLIYVMAQVHMYEQLTKRAMNEFKINDEHTENRLISYAINFKTTGNDFPIVFPFLVKCMDYAKESSNKELEQITYGSLEWGTTYYMEQTFVKPLTLENLKEILGATNKYKKGLMTKLSHDLELTKEKETLIEEKYIVLPNGKKIC